MYEAENIRNIAIIAHVDHGKTTLVDYLLRQTGAFRENQQVATRILDSNDLEKERGITILAKNTAIFYKGTKINIVDTPGHTDFGGEVERTLTMVDGILLLVDAAEGPLPGTKFVLKKALDLNLKPIVVINKIDRKDARAYEVLDEVFDLFISLGATDEQLDFPTIYSIGRQGIAVLDIDQDGENLEPLLDVIVDKVPSPKGDLEGAFQMLITTIDYSDYLGRLGIGRFRRGRIKLNAPMKVVHRDGSDRRRPRNQDLHASRASSATRSRRPHAGDIVALAGMEDVDIGETIADPSDLTPLGFVSIEEPTIAMNFLVNNSPLAGKKASYMTTRAMRDRLYREARSNVSLRIETTESTTSSGSAAAASCTSRS